jgi:hypothetical protein
MSTVTPPRTAPGDFALRAQKRLFLRRGALIDRLTKRGVIGERLTIRAKHARSTRHVAEAGEKAHAPDAYKAHNDWVLVLEDDRHHH